MQLKKRAYYMKVRYHELPVNIRLAIIPLWLGIVSLFFYSLAFNLSVQNEMDLSVPAWLNFGLYLGVFFLLKRKSKRAFFSVLTLLSTSFFFSTYAISKNLTERVEPTTLLVWWPTFNTIVFLVSLLLILLPRSWQYYSDTI